MSSITCLCMFAGGRKRFAGCLVFVLTLLTLLASSSQAQENGARAQRPCVSSALLRLLSSDGQVIRVGSTTSLTLAPSVNGKTQQGSDTAQPVASRETLEQVRSRFEKAARKGDVRGQVNLAVFALAGWGAPANPGAALYWLTEAARQNYAVADFDLGMLYLNGCGVRQDFAEALRYFSRSAAAGDAPSQLDLGYLYDNGLGIIRDPALAAFWYRRAAEAGEPQAQFNLADLYLRGDGVPQDDAQAFAWFQKAAQKAHTEAQVMLASMYAAGRGTPQDLTAAYTWLYAAVQEGDSQTSWRLASLERQLTPAQIAEAKLRAQSLRPLAKAAGSAESALLH